MRKIALHTYLFIYSAFMLYNVIYGQK